MIGIYKITSPKGKVYVGQSCNIEKRLLDYQKYNNCKYQPKIYNSLRKHGSENHIYEIIEECEESNLNCRERYWQDYYNVMGPMGLNLALTKSKDSSGRLSDETKAKISIHNKGDKNYFYGKKYIGELNHFYGKKHSPEVIERFTGKNNPMYGRIGELNPSYGMKHSPEFLRRKQILHSNPVEVIKDGVLLNRFECVSDAANYFNCTTKNILFRSKNGNAKCGKFKGLTVKLIYDKAA